MQDNNSSNQKEWVSTPEDCLFLDRARVDTSKLEDPLSTALNRAMAVLHLIQGDGSDLEQGFTFDHKIIMNALWALEGNIKQAQMILEASFSNQAGGEE